MLSDDNFGFQFQIINFKNVNTIHYKGGTGRMHDNLPHFLACNKNNNDDDGDISSSDDKSDNIEDGEKK
jgi:hypothetical protein